MKSHIGYLIVGVIAVAGCEPSRKEKLEPAAAGKPAMELRPGDESPGTTARPPLREAWRARVPGGPPKDLRVSPDGEYLLSLGNDHTLVCIRTADGKLAWTRSVEYGDDFGFSLDGKFAFACDWSDGPTAWDTASGELLPGTWSRRTMGLGKFWESSEHAFLYARGSGPIVAWRQGSWSRPAFEFGQRYRFAPDGSCVVEWTTETEVTGDAGRRRKDRMTVRVTEIPSGASKAAFEVCGTRDWDSPALTCSPDDRVRLLGYAVDGKAKIVLVETGDVDSTFGTDVQLVGGGVEGQWVTSSIHTEESAGSAGTWMRSNPMQLWVDGKVEHTWPRANPAVEVWVRPFGVVALEPRTSSGSCDAISVQSCVLGFQFRDGKPVDSWLRENLRWIPLPGGDSLLWTGGGAVIQGGAAGRLLFAASDPDGIFGPHPKVDRAFRLGGSRIACIRGTGISVRDLDTREVRTFPSPHDATIKSVRIQNGAVVARCDGRAAAFSPADGRMLAATDEETSDWNGASFWSFDQSRKAACSNNARFACREEEGRLKVIDLTNERQVGELPADDRVYLSRLSNDGRFLLEFVTALERPLRARLRSTQDGTTLGEAAGGFSLYTLGRPRFSPDDQFLIFGSEPAAVYDQKLRKILELDSSVNVDADSSDEILNCRFTPEGNLVNLATGGPLQIIRLPEGTSVSIPLSDDHDDALGSAIQLSADFRFALVSFKEPRSHFLADLSRASTSGGLLTSFGWPGPACFVGSHRVAFLTLEEIEIRDLAGCLLERLPKEQASSLCRLEDLEGFVAFTDADIRAYIARP